MFAKQTKLSPERINHSLVLIYFPSTDQTKVIVIVCVFVLIIAVIIALVIWREGM